MVITAGDSMPPRVPGLPNLSITIKTNNLRLQMGPNQDSLFDDACGNTQLPDVRRGGGLGFALLRTLRGEAGDCRLSVLFRDDVRRRKILFPLRRQGGSNRSGG